MRELTDTDVDAAVDLAELVAEVARCLADLGRGEATQAAKQVLPVGPGAFFLSLAGVVPRLGLGVAKWASYVPGTAGGAGLSTSTVVASDMRTGEPVAMVTGMRATHLRTAATAVATARAARPASSPRRVALVGFGPTNRAVLDALLATAEGLEEVRVVVRTEATVAAVRALAEERGLRMLRAGTDASVLAGVDLAVSATGSSVPVATVGDLAPDGVVVTLDGRQTWRREVSTPVLDDHAGHGHVPAVARLFAGTEHAPAGRVLLDVAGSAVADAALVHVLLRGAGDGDRAVRAGRAGA